MYVVKAFINVATQDVADMMWITVRMCPDMETAELAQDSMWLDMPEIITEIEFRGF